MNIMNKITLKSLRINKTRTIVTIFGVILSAAMITAVTTLITSMQTYVINYTKYKEGDWHAAFHDGTLQDYYELKKETDLEDVVVASYGGYAYLPESANPNKPYLQIMEVEEQAFDYLPIRIIDGRLPQNEEEVVISEHIQTNGGVNYKIGDSLTLELGNRTLEDGTVLREKDPYYLTEEEIPAETLALSEKKTFTIVGICERSSYTLEQYYSPAYTIFTKMNMEKSKETDSTHIFVRSMNPKDIYSLMETIKNKYGFQDHEFNSDYLRYMGISNHSSFNAVLYSLAAILIGLIMVGSITLIYNSFAISVSERRKQFGLLSSVGATSKQRMNSVLFESLVIAGIGIPIGIASGIAGIGLTIYLLREQIGMSLSHSDNLQFTLSVSLPSVIIAAIVALITILISAYIPAKRSRKASAMDAIRQVEDIRLNAKQVKTSGLNRKLFGMEGDIALKNFKRNRRRYRSTVVSLFISIVLFIAASSFAMYLKDSVINVYENTQYDLSVYFNNSMLTSDSEQKVKDVFTQILALEEIGQGSIVRSMYGYTNLRKDQVVETHYDQWIANEQEIDDGKDITTVISMYSVDHNTFTNYIEELGLDLEKYTNPDAPAGILIDKQHYYDQMEQRYINNKLLKDESLRSLPLYSYKEENQQEIMNINVGAFADTAPFGVLDYGGRNYLTFILDEQVMEGGYEALQEEWHDMSIYFTSDNPNKSEEDIKNILAEANIQTFNIFNQAEMLQENRNIILIISVFAYGFIILISLITIANVFNTISTNVNLRRREFAMLKSVGMTQQGFNKMLNFECVFYGLKALLYGIPVAIGLTYLIYRSVNNGVDMAFYLPISSILISIFSVFLVVFSSMMYSMSKIRNENILDALKSEIN